MRLVRVVLTVIGLLLGAQTAGLLELADDCCADEACAPNAGDCGDCACCVQQPRLVSPVAGVMAPAAEPVVAAGDRTPIPDEIDPDEILHVPRARA